MTPPASARRIDLEIAVASYRDAAKAASQLVSSVPSHAWDDPALGEWSIRSLVGHTGRSFSLITEYASLTEPSGPVLDAIGYYRAALAAAGVHAGVAHRGRDAGIALGDNPAAAITQMSDRAVELLSDPQRRPACMNTPMGAVDLAQYLRTRVLELVVHGDDLARALGREAVSVNSETRRVVLDLVVDVVLARGDAAMLTTALLGRAELPNGYSMF